MYNAAQALGVRFAAFVCEERSEYSPKTVTPMYNLHCVVKAAGKISSTTIGESSELR